MSQYARIALTAVCFFALPILVCSQVETPDKKSPKTATADPTKSANTEAEEATARERRAVAISLLTSLADDARNFRDQTLRARTQARIADALWEADPERGRTLFRKAWDAAEIADKEAQQRMQDDMKQQQARTGGFVLTSPPNLRGEVLRLAAKRDRALGEEFLTKFREQKQQEATDASRKNIDPFGGDDNVRQRLSLARQLLNSDDVELAIKFADPVLNTVTMDALAFLNSLREKNAAAADERYAHLLATAAGNLLADANTVSLLSSYLFTPRLFMTFQEGGTAGKGGGWSISQNGPISGPIDVAPELRAAFFRTASQILLRPSPPPGEDQGPLGVEGKYMVTKRLLPLFEQYASKDATEALRAQLQTLTAIVSNETRTGDDEWVRKGISPEKPEPDKEQSLLDQIERAKNSDEKDRLYIQLAQLLANRGDMKARDYTDKIEDTELRHNAKAYIDGNLAMQAGDKKDAEKLLELARAGELPPLHKVWALTQAAKLLAKTDADKTMNVLEEATAEARRIDASNPERARAFMAVANAFYSSDHAKGWELAPEAVKAANAAEGFTGEDGRLQFRLITKSMSSIRTSSVSDFDLTGIFGLLAQDDYERAIELARGFQGEAPRATAVIAIARSVLTETKKPATAPKAAVKN